MNSIIRLTGIVNRTPPLNPMAALEDILEQLASQDPADITLLSRCALCPPSCATLLRSKTVQAACEEAFCGLLLRSKTLEGYLVLTAPFFDGGIPQEKTVVIYKGEYDVFPIKAEESPLFKIGGLSFCVAPAAPGGLPAHIPYFLHAGCDIVLAPCYEPVWAGSIERDCRALAAVSAATGCAVMAVNGGVGDTSCPHLYSGYICVTDGGEIAALRRAGLKSATLGYDVDGDIILASRSTAPQMSPLREYPCVISKSGFLRRVSQTPYLPDEPARRAAYLDELFDYQARSLAARMDNTGIKKLVLGMSGGLDSTLALLVCARACDKLRLERTQILAVTMPGFGTSDRTYFNALQLMEQLGVDTRDISISGAVSAHFEDISHNPAVQDVTYENAQARERAQILFDLANECDGLVVGTGDLSEAALGFSTFGGDHLAGYNVNICINKTTIRELVGRISEGGGDTGETLRDILETPVSPELLPPDESGDPLQRSEEILGPYLLHDFFLYYTLKYHMTPSKVYNYASIAFAGQYEPEFIKEKLRIFIRRFYTSQFKRSCAPDSAIVAQPSLNDYHIPSDLDVQLMLLDLE